MGKGKKKSATRGGCTCTCFRVVYDILEQNVVRVGLKTLLTEEGSAKQPASEKKNFELNIKAHEMLGVGGNLDTGFKKNWHSNDNVVNRLKQPHCSFPARLLQLTAECSTLCRSV